MRRKIALFWGIFLLFVLLPVRSFAAGNGTGTSDAFNVSAAAAGAQVSGSIIDAITRDFNGESSMQESESNDDLSHSDYIPDNTATSGLVHGKESGYNEDYYSFRVSARTEVRIAGICDENTTCIFLLDASGKYLKRINADMMYEGEYLHTFYSKTVLDAGVYHLWVKNDVYPYFTGYSIWLDAVECAHANLTSATVTPTCTEDSYIGYTCTDCIYFRDEKNADALGHLNENPAVTAPTCTTQGYTSHKCTRCGYTWKDSYVSAPGYTEVTDAAVPATCTKTGRTGGTHCDVCHTSLSESTVIPALGHHVVLTPTGAGAPFEVINTSSVPFVLTDGNYYSNNRTSNSSSSLRFKVNYNCTLTLNYGVSSEPSFDKLTVMLNDIVKDTISGLLDNRSLTLSVTSGDTVTVTYSKDSSISSNDDRGWGSVQYAPEIIPADAVDPGCYDIPCYYCQQIVIPGVGHVETAIPAVEPDCTKTGLTEGKRCSVCNTVLEEQQMVPARGHTIPEDEWHSDKHGHRQQCGICGEQMEHEPHSIESDGNNPSCTVCGFRIGALKDLGWFFEKLNDPDHYLWATGNYAGIIEEFGR